MAKENPYQKIEIQIRKQLEIVDGYNRGSILTSPGSLDERETGLEKTLIGINKAVVLAGVRSLLSKLPQNYHALLELKNLYLEFYKK